MPAFLGLRSSIGGNKVCIKAPYLGFHLIPTGFLVREYFLCRPARDPNPPGCRRDAGAAVVPSLRQSTEKKGRDSGSAALCLVGVATGDSPVDSSVSRLSGAAAHHAHPARCVRDRDDDHHHHLRRRDGRHVHRGLGHGPDDRRIRLAGRRD